MDEARRIELAAQLFGIVADPAAARPLAGDAGARRYFRFGGAWAGEPLLVLYPEPRTAAQTNWLVVRDALEVAGLRVPALYADAPGIGGALIEDLGDRDLSRELENLPREEKPRLLDEAEELLGLVRNVGEPATALNAPFDARFFAAELGHTKRWALEQGGRSPLSGEAAAEWDSLAGELARDAADPAANGPLVPTHRDFHANNLIRAADGRLALIDFQDLRLGPGDYDPVSLRFERAGADLPFPPTGRYREAVLLQRAWKVLGTFEKLLAMGRGEYAVHRDRSRLVLRERTAPSGPYAPLLRFLDRKPV